MPAPISPSNPALRAISSAIHSMNWTVSSSLPPRNWRCWKKHHLLGARLEERLRALWAHTFARVAAGQEQLPERLFVGRGRAFVERLYPNAEQRRRLYQYGFTPSVGRRFERVREHCTDISTKDALLAGLLETHFATLEQKQEIMAAKEPDAGRGLEQWVEALGDWMPTFDGLPEPLRSAMSDLDSPLRPTCQSVQESTGTFLRAALDA